MRIEIRFEAKVSVRSLIEVDDGCSMGGVRTLLVAETERILGLNPNALNLGQISFDKISIKERGE